MRYVYTESVIQKHTPVSTRILQILLAVLTVLFLILTFTQPLLLVVAAIFGFAFYKVSQNTGVELEYVHTNDEFDIDKVMRSSGRKHLVSIDLNKVILIAPADSEELYAFQHLKETDFSDGKSEENLYVMVCVAGNEKRRLLLQLEPKMRSSLKQWIPSKVKE